MSHQLPTDRATIEAALNHISAALPREEWARVAMAIKSELPEKGLELFDAWSQGGDYDKQAVRDTWKSIRPGGGVTIGTLFHMAKEAGWQPERTTTTVTPEERQRREQSAAERKRLAEAEEKKREADRLNVQAEAKREWGAAKPAPSDHGYLKKKGIKPYHTKLDDRGRLLLPLYDAETADLWSLQRIAPDGTKRNRGRKKGCCSMIGKPTESTRLLLIAEGFATGATVHQATGHPCAVAIDAGNLKPVIQGLRKRYPKAALLICSDDDTSTKGNPGKAKAQASARSVSRAAIALPCFSGNNQGTDFNDLAQSSGIEEVKEQLFQVITKLLRGGMPRGFRLDDDGLLFEEAGGDSEAIWVCSPLTVSAVTRGQTGQDWGRLLEFIDLDGNPHHWAMPMSLLSGDGNEVRRVLLDLGLRIAAGHKPRNLLSQYLQNAAPAERALSCSKTGWYSGAFVLPDGAIGDTKGQRIMLQNPSGRHIGYGIDGTLDGWREQIAKYCIGNSRLLLAISSAFASPLLALAGSEGGGFHLRGSSSTGKTTAMSVAASVWGGPDRVRRWRATDNALELVAAEHNDTLLLLDELKEVDARAIGQVAYMLSNGQGKARATREGGQRAPLTWRLLFLSTGEIAIQDHVEAGGGKFHAGQAVRVVDIPADAGAGIGLFETLHGMPDGGALSRHLVKESAKHHGHCSREFLTRLTRHWDEVTEQWASTRHALISALVPDEAAGMVYRVAERFALCAFAGELASVWGLTGWPQGEATTGAARCFRAWLEDRGGHGASEDMEAIRAVRSFLQEHGDARFVPLEVPDEKQLRTMYRAGATGQYRDDGRIFYIFSEIFRKEVCKGLDYKRVTSVLKQRGHLITNEGNRLTIKPPQLHDGTRPRSYAVRDSIFDDDLAA